MENLIPIAFFGFVGFVVWVAISHQTRRATLRADMQKQLLERFSSGQELAAFLETEAGKERSSCATPKTGSHATGGSERLRARSWSSLSASASWRRPAGRATC